MFKQEMTYRARRYCVTVSLDDAVAPLATINIRACAVCPLPNVNVHVPQKECELLNFIIIINRILTLVCHIVKYKVFIEKSVCLISYKSDPTSRSRTSALVLPYRAAHIHLTGIRFEHPTWDGPYYYYVSIIFIL